MMKGNEEFRNILSFWNKISKQAEASMEGVNRSGNHPIIRTGSHSYDTSKLRARDLLDYSDNGPKTFRPNLLVYNTNRRKTFSPYMSPPKRSTPSPNFNGRDPLAKKTRSQPSDRSDQNNNKEELPSGSLYSMVDSQAEDAQQKSSSLKLQHDCQSPQATSTDPVLNPQQLISEASNRFGEQVLQNPQMDIEQDLQQKLKKLSRREQVKLTKRPAIPHEDQYQELPPTRREQPWFPAPKRKVNLKTKIDLLDKIADSPSNSVRSSTPEHIHFSKEKIENLGVPKLNSVISASTPIKSLKLNSPKCISTDVISMEPKTFPPEFKSKSTAYLPTEPSLPLAHPKSPNHHPKSPSKLEKGSFFLKYSDIKIIKEIGKGSSGTVFLGEYSGEKIAVKTLNEMTDQQVERIIKEISIMKRASEASHPNVLRLIGICSKPICLVTEFLGNGNLGSFIEQPLQISNHYLQTVLIGVARGMDYLHSLSIIHRDLACRNILLDQDFRPKIADFGLSKFQDSYLTAKTLNKKMPIKWLSPESLENRSFTEKSDVWSFGICIIEIYQRKTKICPEKTSFEWTKMLLSGFQPKFPQETPTYLSKIRTKIFSFKASDRPSFKWLADYLFQAFTQADEKDSYLLPPNSALNKITAHDNPSTSSPLQLRSKAFFVKQSLGDDEYQSMPVFFNPPDTESDYESLPVFYPDEQKK